MTGGEIKEWREACGWSAEQMGRRLGVSQQAVSAWETGENPVPETITVLKRQIDENATLKQALRRLTGKPVPQILQEIKRK